MHHLATSLYMTYNGGLVNNSSAMAGTRLDMYTEQNGHRSSTEKWVLRLKLLGQEQFVVHDHVHEQAESTEHAGHSLNDRSQCGKEAVVAFGDGRVPKEPLLSSFVDLPQDGVVSSLRIAVL